MAISHPDIFIITETWTNDSISNDYLNINGYDIIERQDRNDTDKGREGSIIIYVKKTLYAWKEKCDTGFNQCGLIGLKTNNGDLRVLAVYRSPNSNKTNDDELCRYMERMNGTFVIVGDFNFPDIKWQFGCAGTKGRKFLETVYNRFITQHVNTAKHDSGNILEDDMVNEVQMCGKSDHVMIKFCVCIDAMRSNIMKSITDQHVLMRKMRRTDEPKWLDAEMRKKINTKRQAWSEWKRTGLRDRKSHLRKGVERMQAYD